jgi:hypothetical protein
MKLPTNTTVLPKNSNPYQCSLDSLQNETSIYKVKNASMLEKNIIGATILLYVLKKSMHMLICCCHKQYLDMIRSS